MESLEEGLLGRVKGSDKVPRRLPVVLAAAVVAVAAADSQAGRSARAGARERVAAHSAHEEHAVSGRPVSVRSGSVPATGGHSAPSAGVGFASTTATDSMPAVAPTPSPEDVHRFNEKQDELIRRAKATDAAKRAEPDSGEAERARLAAKWRDDQARKEREQAQKLAQVQRERERRDREARCVFKAVMTDAERENCNQVYR